MKKTLTKFLALLGVFILLGAGNAYAKTWKWYLLGDFNNWGEECNQQYNDPGTFTIILPKMTAGGFQLRREEGGWYNWSDNKEKYQRSEWLRKANVTVAGGEYDSNAKLSEDIYLAQITITLGGSNDNLYATSIIVDGYTKAQYDALTYPSSMYMMGDVNSLGWSADKGVACSTSNKGVYTWTNVSLNKGNTFSFASTLGSNGDDWDNGPSKQNRYGATMKDLSINVGETHNVMIFKTTESNGETKAGGCKSWKFNDSDGTYNVELNLPAQTLTITKAYPQTMYIYGLLNNSYWTPENYVVMETKSPGLYYARRVNANGIFGENDRQYGHTPGTDTGNQNYISFFDHLVTDMSNQGWRYTTSNNGNDNNEVINPQPTDDPAFTVKTSTTYRDQGGSNYQLYEGVYEVTLDLINSTATFKKIIEHNVDFVWYDDTKVLGDQNNHSYSYNDGKEHWIEVGVSNNREHKVAKQVDYQVWYRVPNYTPMAGVKALANDIDMLDETSNDYASQGYTLIEQYDGGEVFNRDGSNSIDDNHKIQLSKAGDYVIIASLDKENAQNVDNYNIDPNTLAISVLQAEADLSDVTSFTQPFTNVIGASIEIGSVDLNAENLVLGTDFEITIEPENGGEGWAKFEDYSSSTTQEDINNLAQSYLTSSIYTQYLNAQEGAYSYQTPSGKTFKVDGLYTEISNIAAPAATENPSEYSISAEFPCSGVYIMTISPISTGNVKFATQEITVTITPNLELMYGNVAAFNINGYGFVAGATKEIQYLTSEAVASKLVNSVAYKPGTYFDSSFSIRVDENTPVVGEQVTTNEVGNTNWINFDFSELAEEAQQTVYVTVIKNGASGTADYLVVKKNDPTGVEAIGAEEGEAVYYNLQGVRVENPQHGIYVKVVNGQATKVVL